MLSIKQLFYQLVYVIVVAVADGGLLPNVEMQRPPLYLCDFDTTSCNGLAMPSLNDNFKITRYVQYPNSELALTDKTSISKN
jgi:hypothetical protein